MELWQIAALDGEFLFKQQNGSHPLTVIETSADLVERSLRTRFGSILCLEQFSNPCNPGIVSQACQCSSLAGQNEDFWSLIVPIHEKGSSDAKAC